MIDKKHHLQECPLKPLNVGFVSQFNLDYIHLVCLGVMKQLILYWKGTLHVQIGTHAMDQLSNSLNSLSQNI